MKHTMKILDDEANRITYEIKQLRISLEYATDHNDVQGQIDYAMSISKLAIQLEYIDKLKILIGGVV